MRIPPIDHKVHTRVLLVDDDDGSRHLLELILSGAQMSTSSARDGNEALEIARSSPPDLVISDLLMPAMDGYGLLRHWKSEETLKHIPFMVYTATYTDFQDEKLALALGADAFVIKPLDPEALCERIREVLANAAAVRGEAANLEPEADVLARYNRSLLRKLEAKVEEARNANRELETRRTQLEISEQRLEESEHRFRQFAGTVPEVFWTSTPSRDTFFYVSPAFERVWGRSCRSLYETPRIWFESLHPKDADGVHCESFANFETDHSELYEQEYRILRPDGAVRWIRERTFPVHDENGPITRIAGVAEDITERRQVEEAHRLLEERLGQSEKMEAIGTLASGIAHDFNNILATILGNAELAAMDDSLTDTTRAGITEITKAGTRASRLVRQILTFSRQHTTEFSVLAPTPVVEEAVGFLRSTLPAGVQISLRCADHVANVFADGVQLHQILVNLGTNAWHALEGNPGTIEFEVDTKLLGREITGAPAGSQPARFVRLIVRDHGCGMDAATQQRIFEPFFTTKPFGEGTGLGLSVVHGLVQALDGTITVTSSPGEGTIFEILLPESAEELDAKPTSAAVMHHDGQGQHILYLDDEEGLVFLAQRMLAKLGYRVSGFVSAEEALAALGENPNDYDLLVTDYNMPRASGLDVAVAAAKLNPDLPVLVLSGYVTEELRAKGAKVGVHHLLEKPDSLAEMCAAVEAALPAPRRP